MIFRLKDKVKLDDGTELSELNVRETVVAGDLRGVHLSPAPLVEEILTVAGRLCAQNTAVMNRLSGRDALRLCGEVSGFLDPGSP